MLTLALSPVSLIQSYFYLLHSDHLIHFLLKGTGQSCYSKSKPLLKHHLYLKIKCEITFAPSLTHRTHTGVSALWATYQTWSVWKYRFPFPHNQLTMVSASSQNALQALPRHCRISKWDLVQNPGSHTQVNRKLIGTKGLPALQGFAAWHC